VRFLNRADVRLHPPCATNTSVRLPANQRTKQERCREEERHAPGGPSTAPCRRLALATPWLLPQVCRHRNNRITELTARSQTTIENGQIASNSKRQQPDGASRPTHGGSKRPRRKREHHRGKRRGEDLGGGICTHR
jgi:hypothetical protein